MYAAVVLLPFTTFSKVSDVVEYRRRCSSTVTPPSATFTVQVP